MSTSTVFILNSAMLPYFLWLLLITLAAGISWLVHKTTRGLPSKARFLIVVPAHNEEVGIARTVRSCQAIDYPPHLFETLVLADNCQDTTAEIARRLGATVVERQDLSRKSKGFALEDLFGQLNRSGRIDDFDAVVVIDADSTVDARILRAFAKRLDAGDDWVQAFDTVGNQGDSWRTRLMTYAFCLINGTTLLGQNALGLSASLRGNGMCLSTRGLRRVPWSSHGLAEDEEFSWALRLAGETIVFEPEAVVHAVMLREGGSAASSQRRRWEYGRKDARRRTLRPLLGSENLSWKAKLCSLVELTLPNTVNIILVYALITALNLYLIFSGMGSSPLLRGLLIGSTALMTISLALYALSPFWIFRLPWRFALSLAYFPFYAIWKLAIMVQGRPRQWVRAKRSHSFLKSSTRSASGVLCPPYRPDSVH